MARIVTACKFCGHFFKIEEVFEGVELPCPNCKKIIEIKKVAGVDDKGLPTFEPALDEVLERIFKGEGSQEDFERLQKLGGAFKNRTIRITKEELEGRTGEEEGVEGAGVADKPLEGGVETPSERPVPVSPGQEERTKVREGTRVAPRKISRRIRKTTEPPSPSAPPMPQEPYVTVEPVSRSYLKIAVVAVVVVAVVIGGVIYWRGLVRREEELKAAFSVEEAYKQKKFDIVLLRAERFFKEFPDSEMVVRVRKFVGMARKAKSVREEIRRIEDALKDGDVEDAVNRIGKLDAEGTPFEDEVERLRQKVELAKQEAEDNKILDEIDSAIREKRWTEARKKLMTFIPHTDRTRKRYESLKGRLKRYDEKAQEVFEKVLGKRREGNYREALRLLKFLLEDYSESLVAQDANRLLSELKEDMFWMLRREGKQYMAAGRWNEAVRAFEEALLYKPDDAEVKSLLEQARKKVNR